MSYGTSRHAEEKRQRRLAEAAQYGIQVEQIGKAYRLRGHGVDLTVIDLAYLHDGWAMPAKQRPRA